MELVTNNHKVWKPPLSLAESFTHLHKGILIDKKNKIRNGMSSVYLTCLREKLTKRMPNEIRIITSVLT